MTHRAAVFTLFCFSVGLGLTSAIGAVGCRRHETAAASPQPVASVSASSSARSVSKLVKIDPGLLQSGRIRTEPAHRHALRDEAVASGEVIPMYDGEAQVGVLVPGRIASILVHEGDHVKKGQVLAWMDAPEAARMQGDFLRARARLWRAQNLVAQEQALWGEKATSQRALHDAQAELRTAKADYGAAQTLLQTSRVPAPPEDAQGGAARLAITSPIDGIITRRSAVVGGHVQPDSSLFEVVSPDKLMVRADVPESMARRIENGSAARVVPRGSEQPCTATVHTKIDRIDPSKRTMGVLIEVAPGCSSLVAGSFADIGVHLSASGAEPNVVVPRTALIDMDGSPAVFVDASPHNQGHFEIRPVRTGITDGVQTVIEDGVQEGEAVVVVGAFLLKGEHMRADLGGE